MRKQIETQLEIRGKTYNAIFDVSLLKKIYNKRMQFSQKICVFGLCLIVAVIAANFILLWFGREAMTDVTTISITVFGGFATCGYFALSGVRDCSLNRLKAKLHDDNIEV